MGNIFSTGSSNQFDTYWIDSAFEGVLKRYMYLLCMICAQITDETTNDLIVDEFESMNLNEDLNKKNSKFDSTDDSTVTISVPTETLSSFRAWNHLS